jgi:hypothetical protein
LNLYSSYNLFKAVISFLASIFQSTSSQEILNQENSNTILFSNSSSKSYKSSSHTFFGSFLLESVETTKE